MATMFQAIRGMNDLLPEALSTWQQVERVFAQTLKSYSYEEIRFPIVESTALFARSIGEVTDIVEKEMYTFADRNGDSLTLRPEGTACCVRAAIEHGIIHNPVSRLWYAGPMFRHERPQKGRYRQFYQLGVETFGIATPDLDAELIALSAAFWRKLGLLPHLELQINSLGSKEARADYRRMLTDYFQASFTELDEDSKRRLTTNPLRILDSKNPDLATLIQNAPSLLDHLDTESAEHFALLQKYLTAMDIPFVVNSKCVRGLDYYNRTVFEWKTNLLGAQGTVCAGGRYDGLVEQLGGKSTPAAGFALGFERIVALLDEIGAGKAVEPKHVYLIVASEAAMQQALPFAETLRQACPLLSLQVHCGGGSFKSQFKRADKSNAAYAFILGDDEIAQQVVGVKSLRVEQQQTTLTWDQCIAFLNSTFNWS